MENATQPQPTPAPAQPIPTATVVTEAPGKKKTSPWVWILSGCLVIIILGLAIMAFLGWMGYKAVKNEIKENAPAMQEFKDNIENTNKEAEKWSQEAERLQKKAQEIQDSLPTSKDIDAAMPSNY